MIEAVCSCKGIRTCLACEKLASSKADAVVVTDNGRTKRSIYQVLQRRNQLARPSISFSFCLKCNLCQINKTRLPESSITSEEVCPEIGHKTLTMQNKQRFCVESESSFSSPNEYTYSKSMYEQAAQVAAQFKDTVVVDNFISPETASEIMEDLDSRIWKPSQSGRRKQDFGPAANFKQKKLKMGNFKGLSQSFRAVVDQMYSDPRLFPSALSTPNRSDEQQQYVETTSNTSVLGDFIPVECGVIEYDPSKGASIDRHFDDTWLWGERLVTLSLLAPSVMAFAVDNVEFKEQPQTRNEKTLVKDRNEGGEKDSHEVKKLSKTGSEPETRAASATQSEVEVEAAADTKEQGQSLDGNPLVEVRVPISERSLLIMQGDARTKWTHAIHRSDIAERRVSLTFRELAPEFQPGGAREEEGRILVQKASSFLG